jgi:hypothetical protein
MSVKRSTFKAVAIALAAFAIAGAASAKASKKKDAGPQKSGGMMEDGGKDPAQAETLQDDEGAYVPGKQKKEKKAAAASEGADGVEGTDGAVAPEPEKPKEKTPPVPRKTIGVFAEALLGSGRAPLPGPVNIDSNDETTGKATSFGILFGGHYDFTPAFRLILRVPWTIGTVKSGAEDSSVNAFGNPELAARLRLSQPGDTEWAVRLGVGIPIAQGDADYISRNDAVARAQGILQRVGDAADGWHDQELYALKRLPITPALLFAHHLDKFRFNGELKASVMPKVGGHITSPVTGTLSLPGVAVNVLLGGSASYEVFYHAHIALAAWARYGIVEQVTYDAAAVNPTHFQFVLEPKLLAQFGHVVPSLGFVLPVGGQLGGDIWGLRLHVDVIF